jgi:hypothetical protein
MKNTPTFATYLLILIFLLFLIFVFMKKLFMGWAVLALSLACVMVSCSNEELDAVAESGEKKEITLTTRLELNSRAVQDQVEMELFYTVYDALTGAEVYKNTAGIAPISFGEEASATLTLELDSDKSYDIAFWAQAKGLKCYDLSDMKAVKLCYEECTSNDSSRAAYYGNLRGLKADTRPNVSITLKSPFALVEVFTTKKDAEAAAALNVPINEMKSSIEVSGVASKFNVLKGEPEGEPITVSLKPGNIPDGECVTNGVDYRQLTSDYLLPCGSQAVDVKVALHHKDTNKQPIVFSAGSAWLNNGKKYSFYGHVLTSSVGFDVSIDSSYDSDL